LNIVTFHFPIKVQKCILLLQASVFNTDVTTCMITDDFCNI